MQYMCMCVCVKLLLTFGHNITKILSNDSANGLCKSHKRLKKLQLSAQKWRCTHRTPYIVILVRLQSFFPSEFAFIAMCIKRFFFLPIIYHFPITHFSIVCAFCVAPWLILYEQYYFSRNSSVCNINQHEIE